MKDSIDFKGHFKIEALDAQKHVIDCWEDNNMIMVDASITMSELFANLATSTFINRFALGTMGHVEALLLSPKTSVEGFNNTRDRMFCESGSSVGSPVNINDVLPILRINDVYYIIATDPGDTGYYRYLKPDAQTYTVTDAKILDVAEWEFFHATVAPYVYNVNFDLPGTNVDQVDGDDALNIVEDDTGSGSTVKVLKTTAGTSVTFNFEIVPAAGNLQDLTSSVFTEAALYSNGRIFSMKTFKAKVKDATVSLRVTWTVTF
jgi:hypothetical protein